MKRAFTLIEVNLAMLIMAGGILSIVGLYSLGFRENRQSTEDVAGAAYADAVLSPLVMALSATNVTWRQFSEMGDYPSDKGWAYYFDSNGQVEQGKFESSVRGAYDHVKSAVGDSESVLNSCPTAPDARFKAGVVLMHKRGSAVARLSFRASTMPATLLAAPMYYTEVRFQGVVEEGP